MENKRRGIDASVKLDHLASEEELGLISLGGSVYFRALRRPFSISSGNQINSADGRPYVAALVGLRAGGMETLLTRLLFRPRSFSSCIYYSALHNFSDFDARFLRNGIFRGGTE